MFLDVKSHVVVTLIVNVALNKRNYVERYVQGLS